MTSRQGELAIRAALGATDARLLRGSLIEGLLVGALGAGGGVACAVGGTMLLARTLPPDSLPPHAVIAVSPSVLAFAVTVATLAAVVATVAPSWRLCRAATAGTLQSTRTVAGSRASSRARAMLVGAEVTLAFVLAAAAMLFARTLVHLQHVDLGLMPDRLRGHQRVARWRQSTLARGAHGVLRVADRARRGTAGRLSGERHQPPSARRRSLDSRLRGRRPAAGGARRGGRRGVSGRASPLLHDGRTGHSRGARLHGGRSDGQRARRDRQPAPGRSAVARTKRLGPAAAFRRRSAHHRRRRGRRPAGHAGGAHRRRDVPAAGPAAEPVRHALADDAGRAHRDRCADVRRRCAMPSGVWTDRRRSTTG